MNDIFIKLEHTVQEVDQILLALAERPFKEVQQLIAKIRAQAVPQHAAATGGAPAPADAPAAAPAEPAPAPETPAP